MRWSVLIVMRVVLVVLLSSMLTACSNEPRAQTLPIGPVDGQIDLAQSIPGTWDRVCFLGPYTTNGEARDALGFRVDVQGRSKIFSSDSISLAVTVRDDAAVDLFEIPLRPSNFAAHHGKCFTRSDARFHVPLDGHPYASHSGELDDRVNR